MSFTRACRVIEMPVMAARARWPRTGWPSALHVWQPCRYRTEQVHRVQPRNASIAADPVSPGGTNDRHRSPRLRGECSRLSARSAGEVSERQRRPMEQLQQVMVRTAAPRVHV
jgi:hypothetical protein